LRISSGRNERDHVELYSDHVSVAHRRADVAASFGQETLPNGALPKAPRLARLLSGFRLLALRRGLGLEGKESSDEGNRDRYQASLSVR
jgi:hypothetical protein